MNIFMFHLMPWPHLPASYEGWAWVKCPNSLYDPRRGHQLYNRYLDELLRAEALGFDGVCVNEHHANAYGNMPSPNLIASILAAHATHPNRGGGGTHSLSTIPPRGWRRSTR
jgi:hypothetical protein